MRRTLAIVVGVFVAAAGMAARGQARGSGAADVIVLKPGGTANEKVIFTLAFAEDSRHLVGGTYQATVWDVESGRAVSTLTAAPRTGGAQLQLLTADGGRLFLTWNEKLQGGYTLHEMAYGREARFRDLPLQRAGIVPTDVLSRDGRYVADAVWGMTAQPGHAATATDVGVNIQVISTQTGQVISSLPCACSVETKKLSAENAALAHGIVGIAFSPSGRQVAGLVKDGTITVGETVTGKQTGVLNGDKILADWSGGVRCTVLMWVDENTLLELPTAESKGAYVRWDVKGKTSKALSWEEDKKVAAPATAPAPVPEEARGGRGGRGGARGRVVIRVRGGRGVVVTGPGQTGMEPVQVPGPTGRFPSPGSDEPAPPGLVEESGRLAPTIFSKDGQRMLHLIEGGRGRRWVQVVDVTAGKELGAAELGTDGLGAMCISPDGKRFAWSAGGNVYVMSMAKLESLAREHGTAVAAAAFPER
jgi:hypothetical protein